MVTGRVRTFARSHALQRGTSNENSLQRQNNAYNVYETWYRGMRREYEFDYQIFIFPYIFLAPCYGWVILNIRFFV